MKDVNNEIRTLNCMVNRLADLTEALKDDVTYDDRDLGGLSFTISQVYDDVIVIKRLINELFISSTSNHNI